MQHLLKRQLVFLIKSSLLIYKPIWHNHGLVPDAANYAAPHTPGTVKMECHIMTQSQKELLDLRSKIAIEYDWEQEEVLDLKAAEEREQCHDTEKPS
jgi:hypothetical protein